MLGCDLASVPDGSLHHQLFAVGNYMYPRSRYSVGMQMAERLAGKAKSGWFKDIASACNVSEAGDAVLAMPLTYLIRENVQGLKLAMKNRKMKINDVIIMTYATELELGTVRLEEGGPTTGHLALEPIFDYVQTESFTRLRIGISHPASMAYNPDVLLSHEFDDEEYRSFFLCNKFPVAEQFALENVILPAAERLLENGGEHDVSHNYTYREVMALADRIRKETITAETYEDLKKAQVEEIKKHRQPTAKYHNRL